MRQQTATYAVPQPCIAHSREETIMRASKIALCTASALQPSALQPNSKFVASSFINCVIKDKLYVFQGLGLIKKNVHKPGHFPIQTSI